jgi:hypothetical protein
MIKEYYLDGIEIFAIKLFSLFVLIRLFLQWYVNYFGINGSVVIANLENEYPEKLALIFGSFAIITALHYTWRRKKSRTIFAFEIFSVVSFFALLFLPQWRVAHFGINDPVEIADLENKYRATIAQIIGGFAIIIGLYNTWQRLTIAENNLKVSQDNLKVVQEGQITERFTRAIDQLGNKKMEIRLGGIYALERISTESKKDYWPIMEILTAYVRKNSNSKTIEFEIYKCQSGRRSGIIEYEISKAKEDISLDIQAILIVIGRRENPSNNEEPNHLNLQATFLQGVQLEKAHFDKADLYKAHLECAHLEGANLKRANLLCAHLDKADLRYAHLEWAKLYNADLRGANLHGGLF